LTGSHLHADLRHWLIRANFRPIGERRHGGDGGIANCSDRSEYGIDGPADSREHAERYADEEKEEITEEKTKKEVAEEEEENVEEKKAEKNDEEKEEEDEKGEVKEEKEEPDEENEDEIVDICVDDTQPAAAVIFGEEDRHFPYTLSGHGHCTSSVSDPTSDLAHRAPANAGSRHNPTPLVAREFERAAFTAQSHIEELKEQGPCVSNPPHAFPSPSPFAFPYTSDSLSASPIAARSSVIKEVFGALNDGVSVKRPDTQSGSTQYTQPRLLKRDNEGLSAAHTCPVASPVVACKMPMTDLPGTAAGAASSASESIPILTSQFASSPMWATKGSETGGSYAGEALTSSFGAG
jgi:hypothetical protein